MTQWVAVVAWAAVAVVVAAGIWLRARAPQASHAALPAPAWLDPSAPASVLRAHLDTLISRECGMLIPRTPTFTASNGDLRGATVVTAYEIAPGGVSSADGFSGSVKLSQLSSDDGRIEPGTVLWFYSLERTPEGWALAGGGTGP